jgi:hypothetical protein
MELEHAGKTILFRCIKCEALRRGVYYKHPWGPVCLRCANQIIGQGHDHVDS